VHGISLVEMGLLTLTMAAAETFTLTAPDMLTSFNAASIQLALFFTLWVGFEYARVRMEVST
jgi:hypothetical protein